MSTNMKSPEWVTKPAKETKDEMVSIRTTKRTLKKFRTLCKNNQLSQVQLFENLVEYAHRNTGTK